MNTTILDDIKLWEIKKYIVKCWGVTATVDRAVRKASSKKLTFELISVKFNKERVTDWKEQID